ncbi:MAG: hypothetical protein CSA33_08750 [Desulfobulbus propionicus]|nr:MAG: hypothetical protein CSA33_08750 [Desulfobulbus propionicus]
MDQKELREFESLCVQEDPPFCTAACPIHVDVRSFIAFMNKGKLRDARKILDRAIPFPEIIGRICDHPCEQACIRNQIDQPLNIGGLERHCVSTTNQVLKLPKLPAKGGSILLLGSGLAAMTAALELSRKGRRVTLVTPDAELGGSIMEYSEAILPAAARETGRQILAKYGVTIERHQKISRQAIEELAQDYDAVFYDLDTITDEVLPKDCGTPDPITLNIGPDACFAGGGRAGKSHYSPIKQVDEGRRAALSIERFLQQVSLTAQRAGEGATSTRLYTSLIGVTESPRIVPHAEELTPQEAAKEAERCIQCACMECVKQCQFLQSYNEYPKTLVRKIFNNESIVQGTRQANTMINSCSLCGQCTVICPNDFPVAEVCRTARQQLVQSGHMPPSAHEFALEDMDFSLSETCMLLRHQPGTQSSQYLFFPGCQLSGSAPDRVRQTYDLLCSHLDGNVGILLSCCGIPAHWAGRDELFQQTMAQFKKTIADLDNPMVITACSSCLAMFTEFAETVTAISLWEILDSLDGLAIPVQTIDSNLAVFDPCTARDQDQMRQSVRSLCAKMGLSVEEFACNETLADCCGFGGLMQFANQKLSNRTAEAKGERSPNPGLAYCAMCRDNLAAAGKPVAHLLDFLFPHPKSDNPLTRPDPGFSARHENRARLKQQFLQTLFHEEGQPPAPHAALELIIDDTVRELMNQRHILEEDLRKVIYHAHETGVSFINPENGHRLAKYRPVRVTYWVEYTEEGPAYRIHTTYSHRMILPEDQS